MDDADRYLADTKLLERVEELYAAGQLSQEEQDQYQTVRKSVKNSNFGRTKFPSGNVGPRSRLGAGRIVTLSQFDRDPLIRIIEAHRG